MELHKRGFTVLYYFFIYNLFFYNLMLLRSGYAIESEIFPSLIRLKRVYRSTHLPSLRLFICSYSFIHYSLMLTGFKKFIPIDTSEIRNRVTSTAASHSSSSSKNHNH